MTRPTFRARLRALVRRGRPANLRGRLALLALACAALGVTGLAVAFNIALSVQLRGQADDLLRTRAAAVAATIEARPGGRIVVREPANDRVLDAGTWIYAGGRAVERPAAPGALQRRADALAGHGETFAQTGGTDASRLYAQPVRHAGQQVGTVVVSVGLDPYRSTARSALVGSALFTVLLLGGVYLGTRQVVGRALRPVAEMSAQAARWSERGAAERFGEVERPDELASLAANLDELLDRLAAVLRHEQQQTAELSHELRTPLARIVAETDWLTARPRDPAGQRASHEAIAAAATTMRQICDTLLSEARTRTADTPGRCAPATVARALAEAADGRPAVRVRGDDDTLRAGISPAVMERVLAPLLDNARRYATRTVTLTCARGERGPLVTVSDDGPGVPADLGDAVFEPGRRGDPYDGHEGAGLGLALARRLARAAGADIELDRAAGPGAHFVVRLPPG